LASTNINSPWSRTFRTRTGDFLSLADVSDRQFGVNVRAAPKFRESIEAVRNAKVGVQTATGTAYIPLSDVAKISLDTGASYIFHERNQRFIPIKFSVRGRDLGSTISDAKERIAKAVTLPTGYRMIWAGEFEELEQAQKRLSIIVPISILLILGLLYSLFNSLRDSLVVLAGFLFAVAGGLLALTSSGEAFGISAAIGFVSLLGISVMNGILLITYFNEIPSGGVSAPEAMYDAATQRMRAILMTGFSAAIGLFPAAFSTAIGSQVQRPLAIAVVGGMLIGPIMLLIFVPALQVLILGRNGSAGADGLQEEIESA